MPTSPGYFSESEWAAGRAPSAPASSAAPGEVAAQWIADIAMNKTGAFRFMAALRARSVPDGDFIYIGRARFIPIAPHVEAIDAGHQRLVGEGAVAVAER